MKNTNPNIKSFKVYQSKDCLCYIELASMPKNNEKYISYITKINQKSCLKHQKFASSCFVYGPDFKCKDFYKRQYYV